MGNREVDGPRNTAPKATPRRRATSGKPSTKQPPRKGLAKSNRSIVNQRRTPWVLIATIAAVAVFAGVVFVVAVTQHSSRGTSKGTGPQIIPAAPAGSVTVQQKPRQVPNITGVRGVLAWDTEGWPGDGATHPGALQHDHVPGPVTYAVLPPVGGPHNAVWMNAGVYTRPVPNERAVHNLEHGAVWITYDPNLPKAKVTALTAFVTRQSMITESGGGMSAGQTSGQANRYIDLSPWTSNDLPAPIVISSWGYQLRLDSPSDPRLQQFVNTFRNSPKYSPEYGSAVDGVPVKTGGRPAEDGSRQPNPTG